MSDTENIDDISDRTGMEEDEYYVETVLGKTFNEESAVDCALTFHVKWRGWDNPADNTWEPITNMVNSLETVTEYTKKLAARRDCHDCTAPVFVSKDIIKKQQTKILRNQEIEEVVGVGDGVFAVKWSDQQVTAFSAAQFEKMAMGPKKMLFLKALKDHEEAIQEQIDSAMEAANEAEQTMSKAKKARGSPKGSAASTRTKAPAAALKAKATPGRKTKAVAAAALKAKATPGRKTKAVAANMPKTRAVTPKVTVVKNKFATARNEAAARPKTRAVTPKVTVVKNKFATARNEAAARPKTRKVR